MDRRKSGLVSIVVPVYNAGQFIAETIHCVQAQTYRAWELLLVDDCSQAVLRGRETAVYRRHVGSICVFWTQMISGFRRS